MNSGLPNSGSPGPVGRIEVEVTLFEDVSESDAAREVRKRAADWPGFGALEELSAPRIAELMRREGSDLATAVLFDRICKSSRHGPFIRNVLAQEGRRLEATDWRYVVIPGAFHAEYRQTGADGARIVTELRRQGRQVDVIPLPGFAPLREGAKLIAQWLRDHVNSPTVLISLSKGGAEVKLLLEMSAEPAVACALGQVVAWIDLSGILEGTPLTTWLRQRPWRSWPASWMLWASGYSIRTLWELERGEGTLLGKELVIPPGLTVIHVVGFPLMEHLGNAWARRGHRRLAERGPNDGGGVLLADAAARPGLLFPAWGADHYLCPAWDIRRLLVCLVNYLQDVKACSNRTALAAAL